MSIRKIIIGSFVGTLIAALVSSTYFYAFFKRDLKKLNNGFKKWDDLK